MGYSKGSFDLSVESGTSAFPKELGLTNVGFSIYVFQRGEGFDYLHNHREQEEVYFCIEGVAEIVIADSTDEGSSRVRLEKGDIVKVDPGTLRAIGNTDSDRAVVVIAGGCPHPYPAGLGHDVIADVHRVAGHGETGFRKAAFLSDNPPDFDDADC